MLPEYPRITIKFAQTWAEFSETRMVNAAEQLQRALALLEKNGDDKKAYTQARAFFNAARYEIFRIGAVQATVGEEASNALHLLFSTFGKNPRDSYQSETDYCLTLALTAVANPNINLNRPNIFGNTPLHILSYLHRRGIASLGLPFYNENPAFQLLQAVIMQRPDADFDCPNDKHETPRLIIGRSKDKRLPTVLAQYHPERSAPRIQPVRGARPSSYL